MQWNVQCTRMLTLKLSRRKFSKLFRKIMEKSHENTVFLLFALSSPIDASHPYFTSIAELPFYSRHSFFDKDRGQSLLKLNQDIKMGWHPWIDIATKSSAQWLARPISHRKVRCLHKPLSVLLSKYALLDPVLSHIRAPFTIRPTSIYTNIFNAFRGNAQMIFVRNFKANILPHITCASNIPCKLSSRPTKQQKLRYTATFTLYNCIIHG